MGGVPNLLFCLILCAYTLGLFLLRYRSKPHMQIPNRAELEDAAHEVMYMSRPDEIASIITHLLGFVLSIGAAFAFWGLTVNHPPGLRMACAVFSLSMITVYLFSTLSHSTVDPNRRHRMRAWDQGTIYLLIAGTYSPFIWQGSSGGARFGLLLAVWFSAILGFYLKVFSSYRVNAVSSLSYILLGWLPALPLLSSTPAICVQWMIVGGVCYTFGIIFWVLSEHVRFSHAIWHIMVMLGTASHCYAILQLLRIAQTA